MRTYQGFTNHIPQKKPVLHKEILAKVCVPILIPVLFNGGEGGELRCFKLNIHIHFEGLRFKTLSVIVFSNLFPPHSIKCSFLDYELSWLDFK